MKFWLKGKQKNLIAKTLDLDSHFDTKKTGNLPVFYHSFYVMNLF